MTHTLENGVDANVSVATAYRQWTQFEDFPSFMRHVESVHRLDDKHLRWRVNLGGQVREFETEIVEQIPDQRIAWRSSSGARHSGAVTFLRLGDQKCRILLQLEYDPEGLLEQVGTFVGVPELDIEKDMARFVEFVEKRQVIVEGRRGGVPQTAETGQAPAHRPEA